MPCSDLTIMIVDDNPAEVDLLMESFAEECPGVNLHRLTSVHEAVSVISGSTSDHLPDALLVDYRLPRSSGIAVIQELAKYPHWSHVPCIVMTGSADQAMRKQCLQAGVTEVFVKPLDFSGYIHFARTLTARMRKSKPKPAP
jgi:CheY-like chemotaxis protein